MNLMLIYAASGAVVLGLVIFALAVLLGVWLVRVLRLPQELPPELHFAPAPPSIHAPVSREAAMATAAEQTRLARIHDRARDASGYAQGLQELSDLARQSPAHPVVEAAAARALVCATQADAARHLPMDEADRETARLLTEAQEACAQAEAAFPVPPQSHRRIIVMLIIAAILVCAWMALIVLHHGPRAG